MLTRAADLGRDFRRYRTLVSPARQVQPERPAGNATLRWGNRVRGIPEQSPGGLCLLRSQIPFQNLYIQRQSAKYQESKLEAEVTVPLPDWRLRDISIAR